MVDNNLSAHNQQTTVGKNLHIGDNDVNRQNNTRSTNDHVSLPQQKKVICNSSKDTVPKN